MADLVSAYSGDIYHDTFLDRSGRADPHCHRGKRRAQWDFSNSHFIRWGYLMRYLQYEQRHGHQRHRNDQSARCGDRNDYAGHFA